MAEASAYLERMREAVIFAGGRPEVFDSRPRWLERAAMTLGLPVCRAAGYFYKKITVVPAWEHDAVMARLDALRNRQSEAKEIHARTVETLADTRAALRGGTHGPERHASPSDRLMAGEAGPADGGEG